MALRIRRGLNVVRAAQITPAEGELIYTTDTKKIFVGDGSTLGGIQVSGVNTSTAGAVPYYAENGTEVEGSANFVWNDTNKSLSVVRGSIGITNEAGRRTMLSLDANYSAYQASVLLFRKSKGNNTVPSAVSSIEELGSINFSGFTGPAYGYSTAATIQGYVDVAPTAAGTPFTINYVSKTGTGPYFVTYNFVIQSSAPIISRTYTIAGNSNISYNGSYAVTASSTTSMTLQYATDPGEYGIGVTTASLDATLPGGVQIQVQTANGNLLRTVRVGSTGLVLMGPTAGDFAGIAYDPLLSGQLAINSTQTNSTQTTPLAQVALRTYANTTFSQSMNIYRARGTLVAPTPVVSGDQLHVIKWLGTDGTTTTSAPIAAELRVLVDNTVAAGRVPGSYNFYTTNATTGVLTLAVKIDSTQQTTFYGDVRQNAKQIVTVNYLTVNANSTQTLSSAVTHNAFVVGPATTSITVNMPASPELGQICTFVIHNNPVTLVVGGGVSVFPSFAGSAAVGDTFRYVYRTATSAWYKLG